MKLPTPHIEAKKGIIAKTVLMPGDPLRAKFIAENYLDNPKQFNRVRGMFGYTGTYKGQKISVMGHGMISYITILNISTWNNIFDRLKMNSNIIQYNHIYKHLLFYFINLFHA